MAVGNSLGATSFVQKKPRDYLDSKNVPYGKQRE